MPFKIISQDISENDMKVTTTLVMVFTTFDLNVFRTYLTVTKLNKNNPTTPKILSKCTEYLNYSTLIYLAKNVNGIRDMPSQDKRYFKSVMSER